MEIMEIAAMLGQEIKKDSRIVKMGEAKAAYEKDEKLQGLILEYNTQQTALAEEYKKSPVDNVLVGAIENRLDEIVREVTANEVFMNLSKAQEEVNKLMEEVNGEIEFQITGERPCTHDCHSCGSNCGHNH